MPHGPLPRPATAATLNPVDMALDIMHCIRVRDLTNAREAAEAARSFFGKQPTDATDRLMFAAPLLFRDEFARDSVLQDQFKHVVNHGPRRHDASSKPFLGRVLWLVEQLVSSGHSDAAFWLMELYALDLWTHMREATRQVIAKNRNTPGFEPYYRRYFPTS